MHANALKLHEATMEAFFCMHQIVRAGGGWHWILHALCMCVCVCVRARVFHPLCYKERLLIIILMWNYITAFTSLSVCRMWVIPDVCRTPPHGGSSPSSLEQLYLPLRGLEWWDDDDSALIYVILIWHCLVEFLHFISFSFWYRGN